MLWFQYTGKEDPQVSGRALIPSRLARFCWRGFNRFDHRMNRAENKESLNAEVK